MYATAGAGHKRAAEAIAVKAKKILPEARIQCVDVLEDTPRWYRILYSWLYLLMVQRLPWIWKVCYAALDLQSVYSMVRPLRRFWNRRIGARFLERLRSEAPDVVLSTHFFPADVAASARGAGWLKAKTVTVITDWHPHRIWISQEADVFVVAAEESIAEAEAAGARQGSVRALGIPITDAETAPVPEVRRRLGLEPDRFTVLVTSGGTTVGPFVRIVEALIQLEGSAAGRLQLAVVCGSDTRAFEELGRQTRESRAAAKIFGFVHNMPELMRAADLIVAKSGGLTIAEALAHKAPLVLYHAIPGQERLNARFLAQRGAAVIALSPGHVVDAVHRCLEDEAYRGALKGAASRLGRPNAARDIVESALEFWSQEPADT